MSDPQVQDQAPSNTTFEPAVYWKLKSQLLEVLVRERDAQEIVRMCTQVRTQILRDAGLNPALTYQLVDEQLLAVAFPGAGPSKE